jgi:hypothetical protein
MTRSLRVVLVVAAIGASACGSASTAAPATSAATATPHPREQGAASAAQEAAPTPPEAQAAAPSAPHASEAEPPHDAEISAAPSGPSAVTPDPAPASPATLPDARSGRAHVEVVERDRLARLRARIVESDAVLDAVLALRAASIEARDPLAPPVCADARSLEALRIAPASAPLVISDVTHVARGIEELCARLQRWRTPDERSTPAIAEYLQRIQRIEGWMRDIRGCARTTGADAARCENAYGRTADAEASEARDVEALLTAHRTELAGVVSGERAFPCTTPTLARIPLMRFVGTVARAQLPELPRAAMGVCQAIGVDETGLRTHRRALARSLDELESGIRARRAEWQREAELVRIRLGE